MKKFLLMLLAGVMIFALSACGSSNIGTIQSEATQPQSTASDTSTETSEPSTDTSEAPQSESTISDTSTETSEPSTDTSKVPESEPEASKSLVVYFSCTGNTKAVAEKIAELTGAVLYEIVPKEPYSSSDLNYSDNNCRANQEMNDSSARPAIAGEAIDFTLYDTVYIGYPIWWGTMPKIINTFLDTYDLSGKTILPFCTSGGSGISTSVSAIRNAEPDATVRDGLRASEASDNKIEAWIEENVK